ncbi:MAG: DUF1638 domain-containing protein [Candidatus Methanofastidiosa archaeon]|nr:DUF1638 domain-containing protein [Candidatus Methanofastidiosa archaeon]
MRRLGIISCQVFEMELAHILDGREDLDNIYMIKTSENISLAERIECHDVRFIKEPDFLPRLSRSLDVLINILPIGLHIDIEELEYQCNENINSFKDITSSILLLYGLCGNALRNIICREDVRIAYPCDGEGMVDDCICCILGRERYMDELRRMGSYFLTTGFVYHRDKMLKRINERTERHYDSNDSKLMLELNDYRRTLLIDVGIGPEDYIERACRLSSELGLEMESTVADLRMLEEAVGGALDSLSPRPCYPIG